MAKNSIPNMKNTATSRNKTILFQSCLFLALAVGLGAFGAHGLEGKISEKALATFKTGNLYHYYHAIALILMAIISHTFNITFRWVHKLFIFGIILFSFNCYLYAFTGIKIFALLVPIGGISFLLAWLFMGFQILRSRS